MPLSNMNTPLTKYLLFVAQQSHNVNNLPDLAFVMTRYMAPEIIRGEGYSGGVGFDRYCLSGTTADDAYSQLRCE